MMMMINADPLLMLLNLPSCVVVIVLLIILSLAGDSVPNFHLCARLDFFNFTHTYFNFIHFMKFPKFQLT